MNKSRWTFALALGTVAIGVVVGALAFLTTPGVSAQPGDALPAAIAWIPETAGMVGHIDLKSVASSPLSEVWSRETKSEDKLGAVDEIREATGINLWNDVDGITFSVALPSSSDSSDPSSQSSQSSQPGGKQPWGMVLSGAFDSKQLIQKIAEHDAEATVNHDSYRGTMIYSVKGDGDRELNLALPSESILLVGSPDYLREMIDCGQGRKPSASGLVESWGYGDFSGDSFWMAGTPTGALESALGRATSGSALRSFALSGRLATDLSVTARGKAADVESAQKLADVLRGFVALGRLHQGENRQIAALADAVSIDLVGDEIHIGLDVPYETIRDFFDQKRKATMDR